MPGSTFIDNFTRLYETNVTASGAITPPSTALTTTPSGDGFFSMVRASSASRAGDNLFIAAFYGTRSSGDNETFYARINGWRRINTLWVPMPLVALTITQGGFTGVAAHEVLNTEYFGDTIVASTAFTTANEIISPADNTVAVVTVDPKGCEFIQVQLSRNTNASCNCLAASC